jgi:hypothetical protein
MRVLAASFLVAAGMILAVAPAATAEDLDPEKVRNAIDRAVRFLENKQNPDGSWPPYNPAAGLEYDVTPICTLALLTAGVDPEAKSIQKALTWLRDPNHQPDRTYNVALQTMVLAMAEPKRDLLLIRRNARWLEESQIKTGDRKGTWSYRMGTGRGDNSNTQFALLGLHEAHRVGVEVSDQTWRLALAYWQNTQNADGSWDYEPGGPGSGSMTSAGISSLVIASGKLNEGDAAVAGGRIDCCGIQEENTAVERGLEWLGRKFSVDTNPGDGRWVLYYLYGLERVGRLTARRFIGGHDWYREGTAKLVAEQDIVSGLWRGAHIGEDNELVGTSFALLFLAKGRRPVLAAKLRHGPPENRDWDRHRSDLGNLTRYVETRWRRDLGWQTIDSRAALPDDLLQAPVLYISGEKAPKFTRDEIQHLRQYVQRGGFIVAEACCEDGKEFDSAMRQVIAEAFHEPEYRLRLLGPEHPVWYTEERIKPDQVRPLWGIDFGCRTSVIYVPPDPLDAPRPALSCLWELAQPGHEKKHPPEVQEQIDAALSIGINILAYATNREVKYTYEHVSRNVAETEDANDRGKLYIAKLRHSGGWNAAPGALLALQEALLREAQVRVSTEQREVDIGSPALFNYHLVFLHGRNEFRLSDAERKQLRSYVERGGMILADSVCASAAFTKAFRREMQAIFPDTALERIPPEHPVFTTEYGGFDLGIVTRRDPRRSADGAIRAELREGPPELEGIKIGDRYAVFFSPYDLSCALESHESLECQGYTRDDAARIGLNVILYSLHE